MSRSKKSRKPGTNSNDQLVVVRTRSESELESRLRKKLKKRKGLKSGSRHSEGSESQVRQAAQKRDPRLGSKKPIPLIVAEPKKLNKQERKLAAEQELAMLEKDAHSTCCSTDSTTAKSSGLACRNTWMRSWIALKC